MIFNDLFAFLFEDLLTIFCFYIFSIVLQNHFLYYNILLYIHRRFAQAAAVEREFPRRCEYVSVRAQDILAIFPNYLS